MMDVVKMMPMATLLGIDLQSANAEEVIGHLTVRPELCTAGEIVHGGTIMAFADCLGAVGAYLALPKGATMTTTIESKTNFLGGAPVGSLLIGTAKVVKAGKRISVWQTHIRTEAGEAVALTTQSQLVLWPA